jgi:hypothetical protein
MADREKVLKGIEACADRTGALCRTCPYDFRKEGCISDMAEDALELLKEQEPVKPIKSKLSFTRGFMWEIWDCGCCGNQLRSFAKYCDQCGRAVKWE